MAHASEKRTQLRSLYVYKRLPMEAACAAVKMPRSTGNRWKAAAKAAGDDWDHSRAAVAMGDENFKHLSSKLLEDYLVQHQAVIDLLQTDKNMSAVERAQVLASLGDSFHKSMASFRRLTPEVSKHAVALDVLQRLTQFGQRHYPKHVGALIEMLEPFGVELAKAYG
jgi:hypothetical protein